MTMTNKYKYMLSNLLEENNQLDYEDVIIISDSQHNFI